MINRLPLISNFVSKSLDNDFARTNAPSSVISLYSKFNDFSSSIADKGWQMTMHPLFVSKQSPMFKTRNFFQLGSDTANAFAPFPLSY